MPEPGKSKTGFTIIEILVVVAIIAILISIIVPIISSAKRRAKVAIATSDIAAIERALESFKLEFGYYPPKPSPKREIPSQIYGYNEEIYYSLANYDLNKDGCPDIEDYRKYVFFEVAEDKFSDENLFLDPWNNPYGVRLPIDPRGWGTVSGEGGWAKPYRIWSNGPNGITDTSAYGMDEDDVRNVDLSALVGG